MTLHPCSSCHRHVHATDDTCPFCGVEITATSSPVTLRRSRARGRLALIAAATSMTIGCMLDDATAVTPAYGMPCGSGDCWPQDPAADAGRDAARDADASDIEADASDAASDAASEGGDARGDADPDADM